MGQSTNGQICYGILLEEEIELPWDKFDWEHDWWRKVNNYEPLHECWTPKGEYAEGFSRGDPRIGEAFAHQDKWDKANPLPFKMVNCCSGDYPRWIIADPESFLVAKRGDPIVLKSLECVGSCTAFDDLIDFCKKHGIKIGHDEPDWYLSSYWG